MTALLERDLANVEAGIYPFPADHDGSLLTMLDRSRLLFRDLPDVNNRRKRNATHEVLNARTRGRRPDYYLQNFHFQSGGWLTEESADRYDTQVEVLFKGTANAMRRQALLPLAEAFAGRDQRKLRLVDIGCGTGRFLDFLKQAWPRLPVIGLDLSEAYVRHARRHLRRWARINLVVASAEAIPAPDNSCDAVSSIFLLHELPPEVRRTVIAEAARVLKPGGRLVLIDSLQLGDKPDYDGILERFPQSYHEPYYQSYVSEDFPAIARRYGLVHRHDTNVFMSKVMVFDKAGAD
jgi:ubiquinone/menaquinone biosynthesis C-methylase UbiE